MHGASFLYLCLSYPYMILLDVTSLIFIIISICMYFHCFCLLIFSFLLTILGYVRVANCWIGYCPSKDT